MILLKKILVAFVGGALLVAGAAMLVLPGPALVVIPAGLAVLAIEFLWARRWLAWLRERCKTISTNKPAKWATSRFLRREQSITQKPISSICGPVQKQPVTLEKANSYFQSSN